MQADIEAQEFSDDERNFISAVVANAIRDKVLPPSAQLGKDYIVVRNFADPEVGKGTLLLVHPPRLA